MTSPITSSSPLVLNDFTLPEKRKVGDNLCIVKEGYPFVATVLDSDSEVLKHNPLYIDQKDADAWKKTTLKVIDQKVLSEPSPAPASICQAFKLLDQMLSDYQEEGNDINAVQLLVYLWNVFLSGSDEILSRLLLQSPELLNQATEFGTPLALAVLWERPEAVEMLLETGKVDVDAIFDESIGTAAHLASLNENIELLKLLIEVGKASPNTQNAAGETPLHIALLTKNEDVITYLLDKTDLNLQDSDGDTPLHIALLLENKDVITYLLDKTDLNLQDSDGDTPLHIALLMENKDVITHLLEKTDLSLKK